MRHIYLNLKRFDIPRAFSGVNSLAPAQEWAGLIVRETQDKLKEYASLCGFTMFFPEGHILGASAALNSGSPINIGSQSVYRDNTAAGGNFGAFTSHSPANAVKALGATASIIGHCEERRDKLGIIAEAGCACASDAAAAVNRLLNKEVRCALAAGLKVLYCIGESSEEQPAWQAVLGAQLELGLAGLDAAQLKNVSIAYEPVWAIGPGKTPPDKEYITKIAAFVKEKSGGLPLVYGGGLKADNAKMLASVPGMDGGLIALTRFSGEIGFYPQEYLEIIRLYLA